MAPPSMYAAFCSRASSSAALGCCTDPPALCTPDAMVATPTCMADIFHIMLLSPMGTSTIRTSQLNHLCSGVSQPSTEVYRAFYASDANGILTWRDSWEHFSRYVCRDAYGTPWTSEQ